MAQVNAYDQVVLEMGVDVVFTPKEAKEQAYAVLVEENVLILLAKGGKTLLSSRKVVLSMKTFMANLKDQPARLAQFKAAEKKIHRQDPLAKDDTASFLVLYPPKKARWIHMNEPGLHRVWCSVCREEKCKCKPGEGAPPGEHPHLPNRPKALAFECCLPTDRG
jgi:hypothetical protein